MKWVGFGWIREREIEGLRMEEGLTSCLASSGVLDLL
jgi:hypothetical protein